VTTYGKEARVKMLQYWSECYSVGMKHS